MIQNLENKKELQIKEGEFGVKDIIRFNVTQVIANAFAWIVVAPVLDIVIYAEPVEYVFTQGLVATATNAVSAGVIGTILLVIYSKTRAKKGSLSAE